MPFGRPVQSFPIDNRQDAILHGKLENTIQSIVWTPYLSTPCFSVACALWACRPLPWEWPGASAWFGLYVVWHCITLYCMVCLGMVWWYGMVWYGMMWHCIVLCGLSWYGMERLEASTTLFWSHCRRLSVNGGEKQISNKIGQFESKLTHLPLTKTLWKMLGNWPSIFFMNVLLYVFQYICCN